MFTTAVKDGLEDCRKAQSPVRVKEPHFPVFAEFKEASYAKRYELLLTKLVRDRLYDRASLLLTPKKDGPKGKFSSPSEELNFSNFTAGLSAHAMAYAKTHQEPFFTHVIRVGAFRWLRND